MLAKMTKENPNDVIVETGNLVNTPDRLDLVTSVLAGLHYDAVGVGETDARACGDNFYTTAAKNKLTVLDATPGANKTTVPYVIKNVDGVKVGIFSFGYRDPAAGDEYQVRKAIFAAYKAVRSKCDLLVVLDEANVVDKDWLQRMGAKLGAPDIVIGGAIRSTCGQEEVVGKTHLVPRATQGKNMGIVDVEMVAGQDPKLNTQWVTLEPDIGDDVAISQRVKDFMMNSQGLHPQTTPGFPSAAAQIPASSQTPYYPSLLCRTCHSKEYDDWQHTKHAHAISTLTVKNKAIPECLACHSEMYRRTQSATLPTDNVGGVECASCHMDALPHGMERARVATKSKVASVTCLACHTKDRSPDYNEKTYFPQVAHTGMASTRTAGGTSAPLIAPPPPVAVTH